MLVLMLSALVVTAVTIIAHGAGTSWWLQRTSVRFSGQVRRLPVSACAFYVIRTTVFMVVLHLGEIILWACTYVLVARDELGSFEAAVYFSAVTFTTLGYGDITLSAEWRLLSGIEAINGIVLIGWTTAFLYAVLQRIWGARECDQGDEHE